MPTKKDLQFGQYAFNLGMLTYEQLNNFLEMFKEQELRGKYIPFCEYLIEKNALSKSQVEQVDQELQSPPQEDSFTISRQMSPEFMKKYVKEEEESDEPQEKFIAINPQSIIDRYRIIEELGRGGMGMVYKVHDLEFERILALKLILQSTKTSRREIERLLREAKALARLSHPGIVTVYDIGYNNRCFYFTMDCIEGTSLKEVIKKKSLTIKQTVVVMIKIGKAIAHAHKEGVIHRDLKPSNIMMPENEPKIMDFGVAKLEDVSKHITKKGSVVGTLQYMAPEQAQGKIEEVDHKSDIYSLGIILYEILVGHPPFFQGDFVNLLYQIINDTPAAPRTINTEIPEDLEKICLKAIAKDKKNRYQSVEQLVEDLKRVAQGKKVQIKIIAKAANYNRQLFAGFVTFILLANLCIAFYIKQLNKKIGASKKLYSKKEKLLRKFSTQEQKQQKQNQKRLQKIMEQVRLWEMKAHTVDFYASQIMHMGKSIEEKVFLYLKSSNRWQRLVAIKAIGFLGENRQGTDFLMEHLPLLDMAEDLEVIEVIWALGFLQNSKANSIVEKIRGEAGKQSLLWRKTEIPYSWLPCGDETLIKKAISKREKKDFQGALTDFATTIRQQPHKASLYLELGITYEKNQDSENALTNYNKAIELNPAFAKSYFQRGNIYLKAGNLKAALANYDYAIKINSRMDLGYCKRAQIYLKQKDIKKAMTNITMALLFNPNQILAYLLRGKLQLQQGDINKALRDYNHALNLHPFFVRGLYARAQLFEKQKLWEKAILDYTNAIKEAPKKASLFKARAEVFQKQRKHSLAINDFKSYLRFSSDKVEMAKINTYISRHKTNE